MKRDILVTKLGIFFVFKQLIELNRMISVTKLDVFLSFLRNNLPGELRYHGVPKDLKIGLVFNI